MAKQEVNIGTEGNDATGDSIRESFRKVNENFTELYAVFGVGGQINFTTLSDTPDTLEQNRIIMTNTAGTAVVQNILASNSALDNTKADIALCSKGKILETGTSNIIFIKDNEYFSPINKFYKGINLKFFDKHFKIKKINTIFI